MTEHHHSSETVEFPNEPIHRLLKPLNRFLHVEAASGIVLFVCAVATLVAANSTISSSFLAFGILDLNSASLGCVSGHAGVCFGQCGCAIPSGRRSLARCGGGDCGPVCWQAGRHSAAKLAGAETQLGSVSERCQMAASDRWRIPGRNRLYDVAVHCLLRSHGRFVVAIGESGRVGRFAGQCSCRHGDPRHRCEAVSAMSRLWSSCIERTNRSLIKECSNPLSTLASGFDAGCKQRDDDQDSVGRAAVPVLRLCLPFQKCFDSFSCSLASRRIVVWKTNLLQNKRL